VKEAGESYVPLYRNRFECLIGQKEAIGKGYLEKKLKSKTGGKEGTGNI